MYKKEERTLEMVLGICYGIVLSGLDTIAT